MSPRETKVTCPCCDSRLEIDVLTGHVITWHKAADVDETGKRVLREGEWDDAVGRVEERHDSAADKLEAGLERENARERDLDDLFKKASDKLKRRRESDGPLGPLG